MATINEIKELALHAARGTAPANFSVENVDEALRDELKAMCRSINEFKKNEYDIFQILIETADEVVPKKVMERMAMFADIKVVPNQTKIIYRKRVGRNRAKQFITRVGLGGVYESFRLDSEQFEVPVKAVGSAASLDFERFLDGADNMADLIDIITEGLEYAAYLEVTSCLKAAMDNAKMPANNKVTDNGFDGSHMQKIITSVKRYDDSCVIFACDSFIDAMGPDAIVPKINNAAQGIYSPDDIQAIHNTGRIKVFRGVPIVEMPQSWVDEHNTSIWIDPQYAYILPTGKEKVVKIGFEGETQMWEAQNKDRSMEIQFYKKMGAAILTYNNWGVYKNTALATEAATVVNPYGF